MCVCIYIRSFLQHVFVHRTDVRCAVAIGRNRNENGYVRADETVRKRARLWEMRPSLTDVLRHAFVRLRVHPRIRLYVCVCDAVIFGETNKNQKR